MGKNDPITKTTFNEKFIRLDTLGFDNRVDPESLDTILALGGMETTGTISKRAIEGLYDEEIRGDVKVTLTVEQTDLEEEASE